MTKNENLAAYFFHQGTNYRSHEYLGVHRDKEGAYFRVFAPNADKVYLVGDFNGWSERDEMTKITNCGLFEIFLQNKLFKIMDNYKYKVKNNNKEFFKADPYARCFEMPPGTASKIYFSQDNEYIWGDEGFLAFRKESFPDIKSLPMNIYEVHLGSWKKGKNGEYLNYTEIANELSVYVKSMGYTHIEIMPIMEYPYDPSWGYQVTGYFAPTARYGSPRDFKEFVDIMHRAGIGVILDWVPAHFPKDAHGLCDFDGGKVYEYQGSDRMEHKSWGTRCFDVGRDEVQCFLISNAIYYIEEFHIDGLRHDAVASMLYLDYDRTPGEWVPNIYGNNKCLEAVSFFRKINSVIKQNHPDVLMIAEESTAFADVTRMGENGLGFDFKWNMGWMNDTLSYAACDPAFRKYCHEKTTFSLTYAFSESYILPVSHDETVHGKKSFLDKMHGDYKQKFASAKAFYGYMMTHPGKKLSFMGNEIGQFREWDFAGEIEWFLLEYETHSGLQRFFADMNHFYLANKTLWEQDSSWEGFAWIDADNRDHSVMSYRRIAKSGEDLIVIINFTPVARKNYRIGVPKAGIFKEVLNSDAEIYGGEGGENKEELLASGVALNNHPDSIILNLPSFGMLLIKEIQENQSIKKNPRKKSIK